MTKTYRSCFGLLLILGVVLSGALFSAGQEQAQRGIRDQLIGAWKLVSIEEPDSSGKIQKGDYAGTIVYTRDGHMSVQIMPKTRGTGANTGPVKYQDCDYEAYYGKFDVDEHAQAVTHHVEGSLVRTLIGNDLIRIYKFSGKQLILKSSRSDEHWTITWEHY